jgi:hypothetical protein
MSHNAKGYAKYNTMTALIYPVNKLFRLSLAVTLHMPRMHNTHRHITYLLPAHPRKDREKHGIKAGEKTGYFLHPG